MLKQVKSRVVLTYCRGLSILVKTLERILSISYSKDVVRNLHLRYVLFIEICWVYRSLSNHLSKCDTFLSCLTWSYSTIRIVAIQNLLS